MSEKNPKPDIQMAKPAPKPVKADKTKDIHAHFEHLRSVIKDICRSLTANMERDILELMEMAGAGRPDGGRTVKIKAAKLKRAESLLSRLSVKPEKGRRSDLKKIEKALEEIKDVFSKE